jgi:hypothetical protein
MDQDRRDFTVTSADSAPLSRRRLLGRAILAAAAVAGGALAAVTGPASAKDKVSKAAAHYQGHPNKGQRCGGCTHFLFGGCALVAGSISSNGWCKLFKASA